MTGEISLRGLAAGWRHQGKSRRRRRGRSHQGDAPGARNRRDFDEIPQGAREKLQFVWLERVDDAIAEALEESSPRP